MRRLIPACAIALAVAATAGAQDNTVTSKTKVKADDARTVVMTGCLQQDAAGTFTLASSHVATGEDLTINSKVKTDVDDDDTTVKSKSTAKIDGTDKAVGTSGAAAMYELSAGNGVELAPHVGHQVEISAVMLDPAKGGDDDAKITVKNKTKASVEDAPDAKSETKTKTELPRGAHARLTAMSVKMVSASCN
jgi:hypothetical protein